MEKQLTLGVSSQNNDDKCEDEDSSSGGEEFDLVAKMEKILAQEKEEELKSNISGMPRGTIDGDGD